MQTVHWGIIGTFATPLASAIASNFCGHNIDLSTISWTAEGSSILVTIFGFLAAHTNLLIKNPNSTTDSLAVQ